MKLIILQPDKTLFNGEVESVTLPGKNGHFTMLTRHASLISTLQKGEIKYLTTNSVTPENMSVNGGFVKIKQDIITVCLD